ncbi:uncharacterized protein LOC114268008 [Camellia sinensis]|uniref:uncharacterized protein LOC114268008 n=1 Tax=Camellia sinensis TaxID=4442 RepID=UPI001035FCB5|nr:uncharacterized protein LOC114268008 [Camellia sinensis]
MALISKKSMAMLFLVATLHFISLSSSTKFQAHARGRQLLSIQGIIESADLFKWLAGKVAEWAMNQLPKMTDNPNAKDFLYNMRDGYKAGKKFHDFITKMESIGNETCGGPYCAFDEFQTEMLQAAKNQCGVTFCVYDQQCKPCPQNSQQPLQGCDPYCVLLQPSDNNTNNLQCQKPCGPTQINDAGAGAHGFGGFTVVGLLVLLLAIRAY